MKRRYLMLVAAMAFGPAFGGSAIAAERLTKDEVTALFVGNSYEMKMAIQAGPRTIDVTASGYADPGGKVYARNNRGDKNTADWKVDDEGRMCLDWQNSQWNTGCQPVEKVEDGKYRRPRPDGSYETMTFSPGDAYGLKQ